MFAVVFFLAYVGMLAVTQALAHWKRARDPSVPRLPRRLTHRHLARFAGRQLLFVAVLAFAWSRGEWSLESVGIPRSIRWLETILAGEIGFLAVILANLLVLWLARALPAMRLVAARGNLRVWPRGRAAKIVAAVFIMGFNPFVEELVMRGVLIHQWGAMLGSPAIPIGVGFFLNAALHWYQGWRMQLWHAQFFAVAVLLLYSPWGLPAAMVAHVFGDVLPLMLLGRSLKRAHAARRRTLRARTS